MTWEAEVPVPPGLPELLEVAARVIEAWYVDLGEEGRWPSDPEKLVAALREQATSQADAEFAAEVHNKRNYPMGASPLHRESRRSGAIRASLVLLAGCVEILSERARDGDEHDCAAARSIDERLAELREIARKLLPEEP